LINASDDALQNIEVVIVVEVLKEGENPCLCPPDFRDAEDELRVANCGDTYFNELGEISEVVHLKLLRQTMLLMTFY
jgi:hypothetical protein